MLKSWKLKEKLQIEVKSTVMKDNLNEDDWKIKWKYLCINVLALEIIISSVRNNRKIVYVNCFKVELLIESIKDVSTLKLKFKMFISFRKSLLKLKTSSTLIFQNKRLITNIAIYMSWIQNLLNPILKSLSLRNG